MKQQLTEVKRMQKLAGILKEDLESDIRQDLQKVSGISLPATEDPEYLKAAKKGRDSATAFLASKVDQSGVSLDSIKKGLISTFRDEPFDEPRFVNRTIQGVKNAEDLDQLVSDAAADSDGFFDKHNLYDLILDLIDQRVIK